MALRAADRLPAAPACLPEASRARWRQRATVLKGRQNPARAADFHLGRVARRTLPILAGFARDGSGHEAHRPRQHHVRGARHRGHRHHEDGRRLPHCQFHRVPHQRHARRADKPRPPNSHDSMQPRRVGEVTLLDAEPECMHSAYMEKLRVGSLFSGIGGLELGLERAGMQTVFQVEIDDYAQRVLAKHWPDVPRFRDVREVGANNLPECDVLCGGFPCQDISTAGTMAGIDQGVRSGLWREFARLIRELRPRYAVLENVSAILGGGLGRVLGDLAEIGYDAEWDCFQANAFGSPQYRDRWFCVANSPGSRRRRMASQRWPTIPDAGGGGTDVATGHTGLVEHRIFGSFPGNYQWPPEPNVRRVADGVPRRMVQPRIKALGNAVVPQIAEYIGRLIVAHHEATCSH